MTRRLPILIVVGAFLSVALCPGVLEDVLEGEILLLSAAGSHVAAAGSSSILLLDRTEGGLETLARIDTEGTPRALLLTHRRLFAALCLEETSGTSVSLMEIDLADPAHPVVASHLTWQTEGADAPALALERETLYLAVKGTDFVPSSTSRTGSSIKIVDVSEWGEMVPAGEILLPRVEDLAVADGCLLAAEGPEGLELYGLTLPHHPVLLGRWDDNSAFLVAATGERAYVKHCAFSFTTLDLSIPSSPRVESVTYLGGVVEDLILSPPLLVSAAQWPDSVTILALDNPDSPVPVGSWSPSGGPVSIEMVGSCCLVACGEAGVRFLDLSGCLTSRGHLKPFLKP